MPTLELIKTMTDYNYALYGRIWDSIMTLSDSAFLQEVDYSHGSLRNHIVHIAGVDGRWVRGLMNLPNPRDFRPNPHDYPTRDTARVLWEATSQGVRDYVASVQEEQLFQKPVGMNEPAWQIVMHLINHGTDHRAQILRQLHDLGAPTFDQDLIMYLWEHSAST